MPTRDATAFLPHPPFEVIAAAELVAAMFKSLTGSDRSALTRFAWLSIATAIVTIILKFAAYWATGSVGLLSDALESFVNLAGGLIGLAALTIAARVPNEERPFGYDKAEYFASGAEGVLVLGAAAGIIVTAIERLLHPQPISQFGFGIAVTVVASLFNFGAAHILRNAGRRHQSITLEADAAHLMTDVWTSAGVVVGVGAAVMTGWHWLDPAIAVLVAINIVWIGARLLRRSIAGLMDTALPKDEREKLLAMLAELGAEGVEFHALRTRAAGSRRFISVHLLVPGEWTVRQGHDVAVRLENAIAREWNHATVLVHVEPIEDPASYTDIPQASARSVAGVNTTGRPR